MVDCTKAGSEDFATRASLVIVGRVMIDKPFRVSGLFAFLRQAWKV